MSPTAFETIRYVVDERIARITVARPDKRNALDRDTFAEVGEAADDAARDSDVLAVIVAGEGPSFCAGIDLHLLSEVGPAITGAAGDRAAARAIIEDLQRPFRLLATMPKPTIAAVQGHALGAGFQLALACDLRVGADDCRFAMLEARYGLIPDLGGLHHLARLVGPARTKEIVWSTRTIDAVEAGRIGLLDRVVPPQDLAPATDELARSVTAHSPIVLALTKDLIGRAHDTPLARAFELEADAQTEAILNRTTSSD